MIVIALTVGAVAAATDTAAYPAISTPQPLNTNASSDTADDMLPHIATDGSGTWLTVWQSRGDSVGGGPDTEILFSRSTNDGWTWSDPALIDLDAPTESIDDSYPDIAGGPGTWVAVWSATGVAGSDRDILFSRSTNGGTTWSPPSLLAPDATSDVPDDDFPRIATDRAGTWIAVWNTRDDTVPGVAKVIRVTVSTDDGVTWSTPETLTDPAGLAQTPQLATDGSNWVLVWDTLDGDHDVRAARSLDGGATWSEIVFVNSNHDVDSGHDMLPTIATDGAGGWLAAWRSMEEVGGSGSDWDILVSRSDDDGLNWSPVKVLNLNAYGDSSTDQQPVLLFEDGRWLALWQSLDDLAGTIGSDWDVLAAISTDGGETWGEVAPFDTSALVDMGHDYGIAAASGGGRSIVVWHSTESIGGTIGTDLDVLYVNCSSLIPGADADCDGFDSITEASITTDPQVACGHAAGGDPASETWPPDLIESDSINIPDVLALKPVFGSAVPPASTRYDLVPGGGISISDVLAIKPYFGSTCGE